MVAVGGPKPVTDTVKAAGGAVGPRSKWLGSWCLKSGTADWPAYFADCKASGQQALILAWLWGDQISPAALKAGVQDPYQGVFKTQANLLPLLKDVMAKAKAAGVQPLVAVENEFNKNGCDRSPDFAAWFDACANIVHDAGGRVLFAPGAWGDLAALAAYYKPQVDASDVVGLQAGFFQPRNPSARLQDVPAALARSFASLGTAKPRILYDCFLSTYGGPFAATHPFPGGDGRALEAQQALAITGLAAVPRLEAVVYRSLRDDSAFNTANWGGEAERWVGVQHGDGSPKPGLAALLSLAKPQAPPDPCAGVKASLAASTLALAAMAAERDALKARVAQARLDAQGLADRLAP